MTHPLLREMFIPLAAGDNPLNHVVDWPIFTVRGWTVLSNHSVMVMVTGLIMLIVFPLITRRYRDGDLVPSGTRNFFEAILIFLRDDVVKPVLGKDTDRFMPFIWTLFFFILINNLLGLLPLEPITQPIVVGLLGIADHAVYGTSTANIWTTGTLAIIAFVVIQVSGIRSNGLGNYLRHFLGGAPIYMLPIMLPVELLGMLVKPCALAIRLFANMTAGHILVAVILSFTGMAAAVGTGALVGIGIPVVIGAVAIMILETFVAFLQAYIFTFLTTLFIGQLVVHEDGAHMPHDEAHEVIGGGDLRDADKLPVDARQAGGHMAGAG
jgi:F-type H+-transporting ATPase subunit a